MTQVLCLTLVPIFYVGALIYSAQIRTQYLEPEAKLLHRLSLGLIAFTVLFGLSLLFWASLDPAPTGAQNGVDASTLEFFTLPPERAIPAFVLVMVCCTAALATLWSGSFRGLLARTVFFDGQFQTNMSTHIVPLILAFVSMAIIFGTQVFVPEDLDLGEVSFEQIGLQAFIFLACSLLGIGFPMRRDERQIAARLGLRIPRPADWLFGVGGGIVMLIIVILGGLIWQLVVTPEVFAEQTAVSRELASMFRNLPVILMLAVFSAVSEEVLFRGALQPIFGLWSTSVYFAFFHIQYGFNPALLLIFLVGIGLGVLRQRWSTSAAIIAHFTFNFFQLIGGLGG